MNSARDEIMARVKGGLGKADYAARRAAAEAAMATPVRGPQPVLAGELLTRFQAKAESLSSTVERVAGWDEVLPALACYLDQASLPRQAVITADLSALDWAAAGMAVAVRAAIDADQVGISGCFCAIAETGTLMLLSGVDSPASVSLLPEIHIALVPVSRLLATMEDAFDLMRREYDTLPRAINFISGPSRTGDIEQTIVLGAHGPCRVHLILVEDTQ